MDPERWQQVKRVLESALESPERDRDAFVRDQCAGDASLQRAVESLIEAHIEAQSFLDLAVSK